MALAFSPLVRISTTYNLRSIMAMTNREVLEESVLMAANRISKWTHP